MNSHEEKTGTTEAQENPFKFTCVQHPKKLLTDIETCGRCGRKDTCKTLEKACQRAATKKEESDADGPISTVATAQLKKRVVSMAAVERFRQSKQSQSVGVDGNANMDLNSDISGKDSVGATTSTSSLEEELGTPVAQTHGALAESPEARLRTKLLKAQQLVIEVLADLGGAQ